MCVLRFGRLLVGVCVVVVVLVGVVCSSAGAAGGCGNEVLRGVLGSGLLPDCRAFEMVTPAYKEGYPLFAESFTSDGDRAMLVGYGNLVGVAGEGEIARADAVYVARRGVGGWSLEGLNAPLSRFVGQIPVAYEAQGELSLWDQHTPQQPARTRGLYIRTPEGEFEFVGPLNPVPGSVGEESDVIETELADYDVPVAATSDYGHIVIRAEPTNRDYELYEYSGLNNKEPTAVNVSGETKGSTSMIGGCAVLGGNDQGGGSEYNALSADGGTVFFTAPCRGTATEVYARVNGSLVSPGPAATVDVSESECTVACGGVSGKNFEGASENAQKVFFTSTQKLTNNAVDETATGDATEGSGCSAEGSVGCNLYEYDFAGESGKRLGLVAAGSVLGVGAIARDGSRVYFVATGRLTEEPRGGPDGPCLAELAAELSEAELLAAEAGREGRCWAKSGADNLYVYDSSTGAVGFVAALDSGDHEDWEREFVRPVEVTGEGGRFLLFASREAGLTSDDVNTQGIAQLFEFDAQTGELVRVTKGEDGYGNDGNDVPGELGNIRNEAEREGHEQVFRTSANQLNMSVDGRVVVFESSRGLSGRAAAAVDGCSSVYEFRSAGRISEGAVHLLSDGEDTQLHEEACGAQFQEMDGSGANVLIATADPLLSGDVDGVQRDIYDVREGGGFAPGPAGGEPALCEPADCEGPVSRGPVPLPGSIGEEGEGGVFSDTGGGSGSGKKEKSKKKTKRKRKGKGKVKRGKVFAAGRRGARRWLAPLVRLVRVARVFFDGRGK